MRLLRSYNGNKLYTIEQETSAGNQSKKNYINKILGKRSENNFVSKGIFSSVLTSLYGLCSGQILNQKGLPIRSSFQRSLFTFSFQRSLFLFCVNRKTFISLYNYNKYTSIFDYSSLKTSHHQVILKLIQNLYGQRYQLTLSYWFQIFCSSFNSPRSITNIYYSNICKKLNKCLVE